MPPLNLTDTIAAIATPLGEGGLAVIRISGAKSLEIAQQIFVAPKPLQLSVVASHTIHYGRIHRGGDVIDEVLLSVLRAPRTFTGEDTVEISCHGGILPAKLVLDAALAAGARIAEPGEFRRRAFLNGRIDLTQAEAIIDLIHSRTELALRAANEQLAGSLSERINLLRDDLIKVLAHVEAHIDFPDEDIAPDTLEQLLMKLRAALRQIDALLRSAPEGQILRRGIRAAIVGQPNVGKSSLLNNGSVATEPLFRPRPERRETLSKRQQIFGGYRLFLLIRRGSANPEIRLNWKVSAAAANLSNARI
jgi:tRNA modification GTPase